ncbi:hypothetical protein PV04_10314 [Phialophora macrospora]|uniref:Uncharacterized protein n=1 Tax=Phialophora macrospora TaxID=1851006 RepID=A0A0D2DMB1_9EURO|nr:hypothetical protein PV04_10314 [Phialophora macrospora]
MTTLTYYSFEVRKDARSGCRHWHPALCSIFPFSGTSPGLALECGGFSFLQVSVLGGLASSVNPENSVPVAVDQGPRGYESVPTPLTFLSSGSTPSFRLYTAPNPRLVRTKQQEACK